jgi:CBS domain-containing protein
MFTGVREILPNVNGHGTHSFLILLYFAIPDRMCFRISADAEAEADRESAGKDEWGTPQISHFRRPKRKKGRRMFCRHYMVRSAAAQSTVLDTATMGEALARMVKHHMQQLLVVDIEGVYVGEITSFMISKLLVPDLNGRAQTPDEAQLETIADIDDRITPYLGRKVADFVGHENPVVHPDTPLTEVVKILASGKLRLPVVDPATNKLVGVISPLTVLRRYQF